MKRILFSVLLSLLILSSNAFAQAIMWGPEQGGNGHSYEFISMEASVIWEDARDMAISYGGHLATISSPEEDAWILENLVIPNEPTELENGPLLGGFQNYSSPNYSEPGGGWEWVTGESWEYLGWCPLEPSNGNGIEGFLGYWTWSDLCWNDTSDNPLYGNKSFIVEYPEGTVGAENVNWSSVKALFR